MSGGPVYTMIGEDCYVIAIHSGSIRSKYGKQLISFRGCMINCEVWLNIEALLKGLPMDAKKKMRPINLDKLPPK